MTDTPRVSVALPAYNSERYIALAVQSILSQTFTDFEFLIVNDGSTDGSLAILERYAKKDPRIRLISRPNTGLIVALNEMLTQARGTYVARMDADDVALPERFDRQVRYLDEHPECVLVGSRVILIDPEGAPIAIMGDALTHAQIDESLMECRGQMIYHPSVMFRRRVVQDVGGYRPEYYAAEDLDLFLRLAEVGQIVNLAEPLLEYREHFQKVGYKLVRQQVEACRRAIVDAHRRRGRELHDEVLARLHRDPKPLDMETGWAWMAITGGNVATARKYASRRMMRAPWSLASWRLLYCALRGR